MAVGVQYYINGSTNMSGQSDAQVMWMITEQSIENNTSTIYFRFRVRKQNSSSATTGYGNWTLKMGDQTASVGKNVTIKNAWVYLISTTKTFTHNSDGTLSLYVSGTGGIGGGTGYTKTSCYSTITIDTIPRATEPVITNQATHPGGEDYYFNDTLNFVLTPASVNFKHDVSYIYNNSADTSEITEWTSLWEDLYLEDEQTSINKTFQTAIPTDFVFPEDINYGYLHFKTDTYTAETFDIVDSETGTHSTETVRTDLGTKLSSIQLFQTTSIPQIPSGVQITRQNFSAITGTYISGLSQVSFSAIASFATEETSVIETDFGSGVLIFNENTYPLTAVSSLGNGQKQLKALVNPEDATSDEIYFTISNNNTNNTAYIKVYDNYGFSAETSYEISASDITSYVTPKIDSFSATRVSSTSPYASDASGEYLKIDYGITTYNSTLSENTVTVKTEILPTNAISSMTSWYEIANGIQNYSDANASITSSYISSGYYPSDSINEFHNTVTYTLRLSLQDYVMSERNAPPLITYSEVKQTGAIMSWKAGGKNITFGGQASSLSSDEAIDCMWKLNAYEGINVGVKHNLITTLTPLLDLIYPIGSIYISTIDSNPGAFFGGEWESFAEGRTLIGAGTCIDDNNEERTFTANSSGGEYSHTLTSAEMPSHTHDVYYVGDSTSSLSGTDPSEYGHVMRRGPRNDDGTLDTASASNTQSIIAYSQGNDNAHNNIQPYITVYMFKRIT